MPRGGFRGMRGGFRGGRGRGGFRGGRGMRGGRGDSVSRGQVTKSPVSTLSSLVSSAHETYVQSMASLLPPREEEQQHDGGKEEEKKETEKDGDAYASSSSSSAIVATANGAAAHATTGRPGVDLFYQLSRGQSRERTQQLFAACWSSSPEDALRIVLQARDIRDGKGERDVVFLCLMWMRLHKPRTYLRLLPYLLRFGSYNDLVQLAHMAAFEARGDASYGLDTPNNKRKREALRQRKNQRGRRGGRGGGRGRGGYDRSAYHEEEEEEEIEEVLVDEAIAADIADIEPLDAWQALGAEYPELVLLATALQADAAALDEWEKSSSSSPSSAVAAAGEEEKNKKKRGAPISLASKWAPSESHSSDVQDRFAGKLALLLFPAPELQVSSRMKKYRKLLTRLRAQLDLVESKMCRQQWDDIKYGELPSRAHQKYRNAFLKRSAERYGAYLAKLGEKQLAKAKELDNVVAMGVVADESKVDEEADKEIKINTAALYPHEVIMSLVADDGFDPSLFEENDEQFDHNGNLIPPPQVDEAAVAAANAAKAAAAAEEKQRQSQQRQVVWNDMVLRLREHGSLSKALALCDVSGSMSHPNNIPMAVSIALGLLVSQVTAAPFKNRVITFSEQPTWHIVEGDSLDAQVANLKTAPWGQNTNFAGVFQLLLDAAIEHKLPQSSLPKVLLCFSDMQFNAATSGDSQVPIFQSAKASFAAAGYVLPTVVFWNLNSDSSVYGTPASAPVAHDETGAVLLSGYSPALMKTLMDEDNLGEAMQKLTPSSIVDKVLAPYADAINLARVIDPSER